MENYPLESVRDFLEPTQQSQTQTNEYHPPVLSIIGFRGHWNDNKHGKSELIPINMDEPETQPFLDAFDRKNRRIPH
jgi:hypothetical protein